MYFLYLHKAIFIQEGKSTNRLGLPEPSEGHTVKEGRWGEWVMMAPGLHEYTGKAEGGLEAAQQAH